VAAVTSVDGVALAEALGMETTAEGIEYMDQLELIRRLRVSHVQGWVYSEALTSADLKDRLKDGNWSITPSGPATQRSTRQAVYRKIGLIHGNLYQSAIAKNVSETGALIEAAESIPVGATMIVDLGSGNLSYASVVRVTGKQFAVKFDEELIDDGAGGLKTARRASQYALASLGLPEPGGGPKILIDGQGPFGIEQVGDRLGLVRGTPRQPQAPIKSLRWESATPAPAAPTLQELSKHYLDSIAEDESALERAKPAIADYILPRFGGLRIAEMDGTEIRSWISSLNSDSDSEGEAIAARVEKLITRMFGLAVELRLVEADQNPLRTSIRRTRSGATYASVSIREACELLVAAKENSNRQLKFILSLLMLTGARIREILTMRWSDLDFDTGIWRIPVAPGAAPREINLSPATSGLLRMASIVDGSPYVLPNPSTKRPYRTLTQSWEAVKTRVMLQHLDLDDLRNCEFDESEWDSLTAILE